MYAIEMIGKASGLRFGIAKGVYETRKDAEKKVKKYQKAGGGFDYRVIEI